MSRAFISATLLFVLGGCAGQSTPPAGREPVPRGAMNQTAALLEPSVRPQNAVAFAEGTAALRDGHLAAAEALLRTVTTDQPELAGPWINLGQVLTAQGRTAEAQLALEHAVAANPENCVARTELALTLRRQGDLAAAEQHYLACLAVQPDYRPAHLNLGILYELYLGRLPEALEAYRRYQALASEPDRRVTGWMEAIERRLGA